MSEACFTAADILLPAASVPLDPWACIAVDQFTSQPEYWQRAEARAEGRPSTLHIVLPEAYLGTPQEDARLQSIRRTMDEYRRTVLTRKVHGYVYVERTQMDGTVRQGLVGAVDLDAYDYAKGSQPAIRPSESTVVERIPPRLKVRRGATLETPHVMMLADDADRTLIEPIGLVKDQLPPLYDGELMLGGGRLRGWAVEDPALIAQIDAALAKLADPAAFANRWPAAKGQQPMVLAVGDGNHSMAAARKCWLERPTERNRYMLAEVVNLYDESLRFEPIHRLLRGEDLDGIWRRASERGLTLDGGDVRQVQPFLDETLDAATQYYLDYNAADAGVLSELPYGAVVTVIDYDGDGVIDAVLVLRCADGTVTEAEPLSVHSSIGNGWAKAFSDSGA